MGPTNIFQWYNIVFVIPAILGLLYFTIMIVTGIESDFDAHDGTDADGDHGDFDSDSDNFSLTESAWGILNLKNRCPKALAIALLFLIWGIIGYATNNAFANHALFKLIIFANFAFSAFVSIMTVRTIAPWIAKIIPEDPEEVLVDNYIGKIGTALTIIDHKNGGTISVEINGILSNKFVELSDAYEGPDLKPGTKVIIIDEKENIFTCEPNNN